MKSRQAPVSESAAQMLLQAATELSAIVGDGTPLHQGSVDDQLERLERLVDRAGEQAEHVRHVYHQLDQEDASAEMLYEVRAFAAKLRAIHLVCASEDASSEADIAIAGELVLLIADLRQHAERIGRLNQPKPAARLDYSAEEAQGLARLVLPALGQYGPPLPANVRAAAELATGALEIMHNGPGDAFGEGTMIDAMLYAIVAAGEFAKARPNSSLADGLAWGALGFAKYISEHLPDPDAA